MMTDKESQMDQDDDRYGRLQAELECARGWANYNARLVEEHDTELAQAQTVPASTCAYCGFRYSTGTNVENFNVVAEHIKSCPKHPLAKALAELAQARARLSAAKERTKELYDIVTDRNRKLTQARADLKDLKGANREYGRQLADVTENREFWHKEVQDTRAELADAKNERDEARDELGFTHQAMQEQSDEAQAEAEGLRRKLAEVETKLTKEVDHSNRLAFSLRHYSKTTAELSKRLTALNTVEATLMTLELATLLESLADIAARIASQTEAVYDIDHPLAVKQSRQVNNARALAARIREALGLEEAE